MSDEPTEAFEEGLRARREVMGDAFVDRAFETTRGTPSESLQRYMTEHAWGGTWTRSDLDRRSRSLLTLGMLIALRAETELRGHVRGALRNGVSRTEITEAIIHSSAYCGFPAAQTAMRAAQDVFDELDRA